MNAKERKVERAKDVIKAVPVIRKVLNDYLDDLLMGAVFYLEKEEMKK